jgi:hypothetical protein
MKEKIDERIKNIPDKIYLQVGDNIGWEVDFKELEDTGEVTWCSDKIENWDIKYIRASELERLINQEVERRIAERQLTDEQIERQFTTSHYHYEKGHYYKVRKDRIFGAKWYRDRLVSQKTEGGGE